MRVPYQDMKQRTFAYALSVPKLINQLPNNMVNKAYCSQLIRCSSSVGANYRASQRAKSSNDFINKLKIVEEEADESIFFLQLLLSLNESHAQMIQPVIDEGTEILKIIVSCINTARNNNNLKVPNT
jgi:four helix bundle protein